jgi:transcriptional regulator GlxA family with amidase domain
MDQFRREFPDVALEPDAIFCEDGPFWTSAGVTAGLDMALALVERDLGHEIAVRTARRLVFYLRRPGGQSQFSVHLDAESCRSSRLERALKLILSDPAADLALGGLAKAAAMSKRSLIRAFQEDLSTTPGDYVRRTRLEIACRLLEQSNDALSEISSRAGFGSVAALRRAFQSRYKVSPQQYRDRFRCAR